jgi:hypothetical protein
VRGIYKGFVHFRGVTAAEVAVVDVGRRLECSRCTPDFIEVCKLSTGVCS